MKYDKVYYCSCYAVAKDYKYIANIKESDSSFPQLFASNNLRELKSFVFNDISVSYPTAKGSIYFSSDKYFDDPIYMVWNEGCKTYAQNQYRR